MSVVIDINRYCWTDQMENVTNIVGRKTTSIHIMMAYIYLYWLPAAPFWLA